jgi:hypothetical protein
MRNSCNFEGAECLVESSGCSPKGMPLAVNVNTEARKLVKTQQ